MQVVTDPQTYQTSEIVEKSSKSGIFSNKRLLVIKNGFLYYFTNVPKNYKHHVPNILSTFKQLPKSSIEIKAIQQIKMESSNSTNLIIKFYEKDMIQRQDIRKSITDRNYIHSKKNSEELEEWKFTYAKVLNCRLWYTALLKLKAYFSKQEAKIEEFFNNFDPVKRMSHMPAINKDFTATGSPNRTSQINIISKFKQQDKLKQKQKQKQGANLQAKTQSKVGYEVAVQSEEPTKKGDEDLKIQKKLETINEDEQIKNKKLQDEYRQQIEQQIRKEEKKKNEKLIEEKNNELEEKNKKIKLLEQAIKATEKLRAKQEQQRERERRKQRERQLQIQRQLQEERRRLKEQERQLEKQKQREKERQRQLQTQLQRQRQKQRQFARSKQKNEDILSYGDNSSQKQQNYKEQQPKDYNNAHQFRQEITPLNLLREYRQLHESSVQTGQYIFEDQNSLEDNDKIYQSYHKRNNQSYLSGLMSTQRDTFNVLRNAGSFSFELQDKDRSYENYDYYTEVEAIQNNELKFEQRIKKQIKIINYVKKMKDIAQDMFKQYIDTKHPTKSVSFMGTLFEMSIVCSNGKIININGNSKLVYSNQQHQKLKRQFKIYNDLQDKFIELTEKRKKFPLRVPLCFFFEYLGYSGLLKYLPYLKPIEDEQEINRATKYLKKTVEQQNIGNYQYRLIANRVSTMYMVLVKNPYKVTKNSKNLQMNSQDIYGPKFLLKCRNKLKSTNSARLQEEMGILSKQNNKQSFKKMMCLNQALLCRSMKNLYRSTQPFLYDENTHIKNDDFFGGFFARPANIREMISDSSQIILNGLLISYFEHFFGLKVPSGFDIYNINFQQKQYECEPIFRMFSFNSLYPHKLLRNLQKYISSQKYQIVEIAFDILNQIDTEDYSLQLYRIKYQLKRTSNFNVDHEKIKNMIKALNQIRLSVGKHNPICLECYMLTIQCQNMIKDYGECLNTINETLEYVAYMFGPQFNEGQLEDYLYLLVAETLAKMGNHSASMNIYIKLLENPENSLSQQQISLSIAEVYSNFGNVDSSTLISFLLSLISKQKLSQSQVKKAENTFWQARIRKFIGILYKQIGNFDLCVKYLQESLNYYEQNGLRDQESVNDVVEICLNLFNIYQNKKDRAIIFTKFIMLVQINSQNEKFSVHIVRMTRAFVTACFCSFIKTLDKQARRNLGSVLQQIRDGGMIIPQTVHSVNLQDVQKTLMKLATRSELGTKQAKIMQLLDISQIQIFNIALN